MLAVRLVREAVSVTVKDWERTGSMSSEGPEVGERDVMIWNGCYNDTWAKWIVPDAFAHP